MDNTLPVGDMQEAIAAVRCPSCGRKASYVGIKWHAGSYYVIPAYSCDTEDCEFRLEGPSAWTIDLRD